MLAELPPGARVLDCACGTGTLAVGLALRGFEVSASDASEAMVARTRALAAAHGVRVEASVRVWEELDGGPFDAVFCVGNSITHARDRRAALAGMRGVLRDGAGLLALDLAHLGAPAGGGGGGRGARRPARARARTRGTPASSRWRSPSTAPTHAERLAYWPFTHEELQADLLATGFEPVASTFSLEAPRYLVTSRANSSNASR